MNIVSECAEIGKLEMCWIGRWGGSDGRSFLVSDLGRGIGTVTEGGGSFLQALPEADRGSACRFGEAVKAFRREDGSRGIVWSHEPEPTRGCADSVTIRMQSKVESSGAPGRRRPRRNGVLEGVFILVCAVLGLTSSAFGDDEILCLLGPSRAVPEGPVFDVNQMRHCTCPESIAFFANSDRVYEAALMWNGTGLEEPNGAFAERYETPGDQAGAVCQVTIQTTDNGNRIRSAVDLFVWRDDNGRPGEVAGVIRGIDLGPAPVWPRYATRELEVYEIQQIGVQGPFWVGVRGAWDRDSCSVYMPIDIEGDRPETVRAGMTYVPPGTPFPEGWQPIETVYGRPAALAIGVVVGWCPVPVQDSSWGCLKTRYR